METTEKKLLDLIPEALRQDFIEEVRQLIANEPKEKQITSAQADTDIKKWAAKQSKTTN